MNERKTTDTFRWYRISGWLGFDVTFYAIGISTAYESVSERDREMVT